MYIIKKKLLISPKLEMSKDDKKIMSGGDIGQGNRLVDAKKKSSPSQLRSPHKVH